ncbi:acetyl-CoA carboxylase [Brevibacterium casei]|uniref:acetyl-CoA carboxylase n=1 Tax=Brevibacterium TaxID=1696 RepID=UPI0011AB1C2D|nr:acetyl-CoA carboxylase [Brevibacterium casei]QQT69792.1 biotin carboxyl carrier domain-containing protein [Brevibacterium casei]QZE25940.1 biotin carboxyl carrier domain-containing protein [Brevibacterium casei]
MADIISPMPGVFYRKPAPGKADFVKVGDSVEAGQTIGIVEIMKQFTEVKADTAGTIVSFSAEDEGMVNPGDVIATIDEA